MSFLYLSCMPMLLAATFKESPFAASQVLDLLRIDIVAVL